MSEAKVIPVFHKRNADPSTELREETRTLLEGIIKRMVDDPQSVSVRFSVGEKTTVFVVDCSKEAISRLIGAGGKNIMGLRHVIASIMAKKGLRSVIEIPYYRQDR
ncbi:KH domain-containing protein [Bdellovibrio sp. 22V]|uniref:KH domain-containing protein n=1 Tax=Bdellovibrio TaxID=958 RepID=UPI002543094F|nr:KH domain-containing protein [Bdellovibrio sp. 22V]WII71550.1 KH domain-containing protein [Bdellovibrio sp. 22V]